MAVLACLLIFISTFNVYAEDSDLTLSCHSLINLSLDNQCTAIVDHRDLLTTIPVGETFTVEMWDKDGNLIYNNMLTIDDLWTRVTAKVYVNSTGNSCWSYIDVEDKLAPLIICDSYEVDCYESFDHFQPFHFDACGSSELQLLSQETVHPDCNVDYAVIQLREYIAIDEYGNKSLPCQQQVGINRFDCDLVEFPEDYELINMTHLNCADVDFDDDGFPLIEDTGIPSYNGNPMHPDNYECEVVLEYEDIIVNTTGCAQKFMRTWSIYRDSCGVFVVKRHQQIIEISDTEGPVIICPESRSVNTDGSPGCDAMVTLKLADYTDDCNQIIEMDIVTPEIFFNNIDTMPELVLDVGVNVIQYTVYDACDNSASCESVITVVDNAPPVARCDESTVVSLRSDGTASAYAFSFDEGSFDDCNLYKSLIKRVDSPCECPPPVYHDMNYLGEWNESHYYISTIERFGFEAFNYSIAQGGTILKTETLEEHDWVLTQIRDFTDASYLIGLKDFDSSGVFKWFDYSSPLLDLWDDGEPDDDIYAVVNEDGYWEAVDATLDRYFFVMELDEPCNFGDKVYFCCEDASQDVPLVLRVIDRFGRYNDCEFTTEVQDKVAPVIQCPNDITLDCSIEVDTTQLNIYGVASATDQCFANVTEEFLYDVNNCGVGSIMRYFTAADANGESTCDQLISLEMLGDPIELEIIWPDDYESDQGCLEGDVHPDNLPDGFDYPDFSQTDCSILTANFSDRVYSFVGVDAEACFKVIRTWTIIDECQLDDLDYEPIEYEQVLKISNSSAPVLDSGCEDITISTDDCNETEVSFEVLASDDCTSPQNIRGALLLDINSDGQGDFDLDDDSFENMVEYEGILNVGNHFALIEFRDQCGNSTTCTKLITVESTTGPDAVCVPGLVTVIQDMDMDGDGNIDAQMAILIPENLDAYNESLGNDGSTHPCEYDIFFSFSADPDDQMRVFNCDDVGGDHELELWVTDEFGNTDVCSTTIDVQDIQGRCDPNFNGTHTIAGKIITETDELISNAIVQLQGSIYEPQISNADGNYAFPNTPSGNYYTISPSKDDHPLDGVSTLDVLKIQRHILGLQNLDSPYKMIAADIDRSNSISARDLIELRKLILGIYDEFPQNSSWRMIDAAYKFLDPANPFLNTIAEEYEILDLQESMNVNFIGVKVGDVDNSNSFDSRGDSERRNRTQEYIRIQEKQLTKGSTHELVFSLEEMKLVDGIQLALSINPNKCRVISLEGLDLDLDSDNLNTSNMDKGEIRLSWSSAEPAEAKHLFKMIVYVNKDSYVSELTQLSNEILKAEMYRDGTSLDLEMSIDDGDAKANGFYLYQNAPNPWQDFTSIRFHLEKETETVFSVFDINGRLIYQEQKLSNKGVNLIELSRHDLNSQGVMYYEIATPDQREVRKMILIE